MAANIVHVGDTGILPGRQFHSYLAQVRRYVFFKFISTDSASFTPVTVLIPLISKGCLKACKVLKGHHSHSSNSWQASIAFIA